jgi:hypothetical protein
MVDASGHLFYPKGDLPIEMPIEMGQKEREEAAQIHPPPLEGDMDEMPRMDWVREGNESLCCFILQSCRCFSPFIGELCCERHKIQQSTPTIDTKEDLLMSHHKLQFAQNFNTNGHFFLNRVEFQINQIMK